MHHCSVSWKINPLYFLAQTLYTLEKKSPLKWNFQNFEWMGENLPSFSCHIRNHKPGFLSKLHRFPVSREVTLLHFLSWNFKWFGQKEPIKVENFRLSATHVKSHQICTLISCFCWRFIKFHLKKMSYPSWYWILMQNLKKNKFLVSKMTRIWWIFIWAIKNFKNVHFDWYLLCKVCNVWPNNVQRSYRSWHWSFMQNFKKNWFVVWKIFYQNTWKCQSWDFEGIPLSKVENAWAKTLQISYV